MKRQTHVFASKQAHILLAIAVWYTGACLIAALSLTHCTLLAEERRWPLTNNTVSKLVLREKGVQSDQLVLRISKKHKQILRLAARKMTETQFTININICEQMSQVANTGCHLIYF